MSGIFISYRRQDSRGDAGRLATDLKAAFGEEQIFRDIETIEAGSDFAKAIGDAVGSCDVLLAVIGPSWLTTSDKNRRRLDDPDDFVRLEIVAALNRGIGVIPVLVGDATMPRREDLPKPLHKLARRQAHELSDSRWAFDVQKLVTVIEKGGFKRVPQHRPEASPDIGIKPAMARNTRIKAIASTLLLLPVIGFYALRELDRQGIIGGIVISLVALVLGLTAYRDVRRNETKGESLAMTAIVLAVLMALVLFGEFAAG